MVNLYLVGLAIGPTNFSIMMTLIFILDLKI